MAVHVKVMCLSEVCRHGKRPAKAARVCLCGLLVIAIILLTFTWSGFHSNNGRVLDQNDVGSDVIVHEGDPSHSQVGRPFVKKTPQHPESVVSAKQTMNSLIWRPQLSNVSKIILIRIPKTGSRTLRLLVGEQAKQHGVDSIDFPFGLTTVFRRDVMDRHPGRVVFSAHMKYMQFKWREPPIYLSMTRDPIARFVSSYYYNLYSGMREMPSKHTLLQREKMMNFTGNATIPTVNECVLRELPYCTDYNRMFNTLLCLCGGERPCWTANNWTYAQAVRHIDGSLAVGLTEEFEDYLRVLERLLPDVFQGIVGAYHKPNSSAVMKNSKTKFKEPLSPEAESKLRRQLEMEYRIYNYTRDRFHKIKRRLGIV